MAASRFYTYPAVFEPGDDGGFVVTFPDVEEAITQGVDRVDAMAQAVDALGTALLFYAKEGRSVPAPCSSDDLSAVTVAPDVAAKLAVLEAFADAGISKSELGRRIGRDEKEVRRILDPLHPTKLPLLSAALAALGRRLVVGVEEADVAA